MADQAPTPTGDIDWTRIPQEDIDHLRAGEWNKVSQPVVDYIRGVQTPRPTMAPATGLAGPVGDAISTVAGPFDTLATTLSHAVAPIISGVGATAARVAGQGEEGAKAVHDYVDKNSYHATTPMGHAAENDAAAAGRVAMTPFNAAANAIEAPMSDNARQTVEQVAGGVNDAMAAAPIGGAAADAARASRAASEASQVARGGADVAREAGYTGLRAVNDLKSPGAQSITDRLISHDAGLLPGQTPSVANVQNARVVGPGRVYDRMEATLPRQMTADATLRNDIGNVPGDTSQLPRSPDVDQLRDFMQAQPNMTNQELFANIRTARQRAAAYLASDNPDQVALGGAYSRLADAYENFAGRQIPINGVPLAQWQAARVEFAKSYLAEAALKGGEHFDAGVYGRAARGNPDLLSGGAKVVGDTYNSLPAEGQNGVARAAGAALGAAGGIAAEHFVPGASYLGPVGGAVVGQGVAPAIHEATRRFFMRGDPEAAAAAPTNPRLSYFYQRDTGAPAPRLDLSQPPGSASTPQARHGRQLSLGDLAQGDGPPPFSLGEGANPNPPAAGGRPGDIPLADVLSHGVERNPPPGLTAGPMGHTPASGIPFQVNAGHAAGDLGLAPEDSWMHGPATERLGDLAAVQSQGVPEGTMTRTAPKGGRMPSAGKLGDFLTNNGSGESAASQEAISRGTRDLVQVDPDGNATPVMRDVTQIDRSAPKGSLIVDRSSGEIISRGGMNQRAAEGLRNRWASRERLGDGFVSK